MDIIKRFRLLRFPLIKETFQYIMRHYPEFAYSVMYFISDIRFIEDPEGEEPMASVSLSPNKTFIIHVSKNKLFQKYSHYIGSETNLLMFLIIHELFHILLFHLTRKNKILKIYTYIDVVMYNYIVDEIVNEIIFHSVQELQDYRFRDIFVTRNTVLMILDKLKELIGCRDEDAYNKLWNVYKELDIYEPVEKRCDIVNQMLQLLNRKSGKSVSIEDVVSQYSKNIDWYIDNQKTKKEESIEEYYQYIKYMIGEMDSDVDSEKESDSKEANGVNDRVDNHKYPGDNDIEEHDIRDIEEKIGYITKEMEKRRDDKFNLWERIIKMQNDSNEIIKNVMKKLSRIKKIKGVISRVITVSLYTKEIPSKEMINKRNLIINEEYAYLTRPFKRETLFAELNFFVDVSGSINEKMLSTIMSGIKNMFLLFQLKVNVYVWSIHPDDPIYLASLSPSNTIADIVESINKMKNIRSGGGTMISPTIKFIDNIKDYGSCINIIYTDGYVEEENELYRLDVFKERNVLFIIDNEEKSSVLENVYVHSQIVYI